MSIPDYQTLMRPALIILKDQGSMGLRQLVEELSSQFQLSEEERRIMTPSNRCTLIYNRVAWCTTYLRKAGLIKSLERGVSQITPAGCQALLACPDRIDNKYLKQFDSFFEGKQAVSNDVNIKLSSPQSIPLDPTERFEKAYQELHYSLADDLLPLIKQQSPAFFEKLVVELMLAMGYGGWSEMAGQVTQYTNDGGVDGIINEDPLGLDTIYLQAKRYSENVVSRPDVQSFVGALEMKRARKGVFITTSRFSRDAIEYVNMIEKRVVLIDGMKLAELMIQYNLGVSVKETYQIKSIDSDYFEI